MRTLFTTAISHIDRSKRDDALGSMTDALRAEFPAYRVVEWSKGDHAAAVWVEPFEREIATESGVREVPIPAHLNGWGHGDLTLKLVA